MTDTIRLKGVAASIGVAIGPAWHFDTGKEGRFRMRLDPSAVPSEVERFADAVERSRAEIEAAKQQLTEQHGSTYGPILDVHLLMHADALLIDATSSLIAEEAINAEWALARVSDELKAPLLADASSYFRERANDIEHVKAHLLRHLSGETRNEPSSNEPRVIVARDLTPADAVHMLAPPTVGLVTELGAANSHTAILARTFGVPAVVSVGRFPVDVRDGEPVLVDGFSGDVTLRAGPEELDRAAQRRDRFNAFLQAERSTAAVTRDGTSIAITANAELPREVDLALTNGAEGIGLYRTEFMCLDRPAPPSEDAQHAIYAQVARAMAPRRVVFRTFDWRGDKRLRVTDAGGPRQGWLRTQVRAILRASHEGSLAIMFPMVASLSELVEARSLVERCREEIEEAGVAVAEVPVGMMVETPAAALLADRFAEEADFFAVGTNDLSHQTLAHDREDHRSVADALDPAVLELLQRTVRAADAAGIPCSVCGGMAADPVALGVALGLGFRQLSVPVSVVPLARAVVRGVDLGIAADLADEAQACRSADEVRNLVVERLGPDLGALWREQGLL